MATPLVVMLYTAKPNTVLVNTVMKVQMGSVTGLHGVKSQCHWRHVLTFIRSVSSTHLREHDMPGFRIIIQIHSFLTNGHSWVNMDYFSCLYQININTSTRLVCISIASHLLVLCWMLTRKYSCLLRVAYIKDQVHTNSIPKGGQTQFRFVMWNCVHWSIFLTKKRKYLCPFYKLEKMEI